MRTNEENGSLFSGFNFTGFSEDEPTFEAVETAAEDETDTEQETDEVIGEEIEEDIDEGQETDSPSDESKRSSSSFKVLANALSEEGVLSSLEESAKVDSAEDLIGLIQGEINARVDKYKNELPDEIRELVEKYDEGVDLLDILELKKDTKSIDKIKDEDFEDNESLMKQILTRDLKERGMSDEDINDEIEDIFSLGKEDIKAKKALERIKSRLKQKEASLAEEAKTREAQRAKEYQELLASTKKAIEDTKEFAGVELTRKLKDEVFDAMTKPIAEINGTPVNAIVKKRMENPTEFDRNMATMFVITKGFTDFSKFTGTLKRTAIKELEQSAERISRELGAGVNAPNYRKTSSTKGTVLQEINMKNIV